MCLDSRSDRRHTNMHKKLIMKRLTPIIVFLLSVLTASAQMDVRFGDESTDTLRLNKLLQSAADKSLPTPEARTAFFGRQFIGTPYGAHTLEGPEEILTVRLDSLDCTTFVETALALAYTCGERRSSWRDFLFNLRRIRYRNGEINGYPSRLHYIADWAVDNKHRGNISDATSSFPRVNHIIRSIDFMSAHRKAYPALADSANFERIRSVESGYRNHKFPYIKTSDLNIKAVKAAFRNGDILAFVSNLKDLDVTHMGMVVKDSPDAEPYVLHASQTNGKVEISSVPLAEFVKRNRNWIGVRVFRLMD